jgi:uncharacterized Ntn-hydrolase superfamily protein
LGLGESKQTVANHLPFGTFSILALDPQAGEIGIAVASRFLAVGSVVPWAQAGVGGVATQAWANLNYGPEGLRLLTLGFSPAQVVERLIESDQGKDHRQLGVLDALGRSAAWTGRNCFPWAGHLIGDAFTCQGNILSGQEVVEAMAESFEKTAGPLPERLTTALQSGQSAGGDSRGQQSAALLVVKEGGSYGGYLDRYIDLRSDDASDPILELARLLRLHRVHFPTTGRQLARIAGNVVLEVQRVLGRLDFYQGELTGRYDEITREAFRQFCRVNKFEALWREDDLVDREILNYVQGLLRGE